VWDSEIRALNQMHKTALSRVVVEKKTVFVYQRNFIKANTNIVLLY